MQNKKGFTLVELLVVIAIIGILSSVAVVNLNNARIKAKINAQLSNFNSLLPAILLCFDDGEALNKPSSIYGGGDICNNSNTTWPLTNNPDYGYSFLNTSGDPIMVSSPTNGTFFFGFSNINPSDFPTILCQDTITSGKDTPCFTI